MLRQRSTKSPAQFRLDCPRFILPSSPVIYWKKQMKIVLSKDNFNILQINLFIGQYIQVIVLLFHLRVVIPAIPHIHTWMNVKGNKFIVTFGRKFHRNLFTDHVLRAIDPLIPATLNVNFVPSRPSVVLTVESMKDRVEPVSHTARVSIVFIPFDS